MLCFLLSGLGLGLASGIAPGPLMALLVAQTLRYGTREGLKVAAAPALTDVPIVALCMLVLARIPGRERLLAGVAVAGAAYLSWLAWSSLRFQAIEWVDSNTSPGSIGKSFVTNLLNPHVYLFWIAVGSPLVLQAWKQDPSWAAAFLAGFYGCLVGLKLLLAALIGRSRAFLTGRAYTMAIRTSGVLLLLIAGWLLSDGVRLLFG